MNGVRSIAINIVSLSIAEIITKISQFLIFVFIARSLGNVIFGRFNFAYAFSIITVMFMDIGINYMLVRDISRNKNFTNKFIVNSFLIKICLSLAVFIIIYLILNAADYPAETRLLIYILVCFEFFKSFTEMVFSIFKAYEVMYYEAFLKSLRMILTLIFGLLILNMYMDVILLAAIFVLIEAIIFIFGLFIALSKIVRIKFSFDYNFSKNIIKKAFPFSLSMIFASVYFYIGSIMLSVMKGDSAVGTYSAAYNLTLAILFIPGMYVFAIYPVLSKNLNKSKDIAVLIYERSFKYLYIIGLPISIGFFLLARNIMLFIYGKEFFASVIVLKLVSWFVFIKFISYLTGIILSVNAQHLRALSQGIAALLNLALNFLLIPKFSYIGAGVATLISEIILFILTFAFVSKYFHAFNVFKILYKPLIASAIMAAVIIFLKADMFILIFTGAVTYFLILFLLRAFDERDYLLMKRLIKGQ